MVLANGHTLRQTPRGCHAVSWLSNHDSPPCRSSSILSTVVLYGIHRRPGALAPSVCAYIVLAGSVPRTTCPVWRPTSFASQTGGGRIVQAPLYPLSPVAAYRLNVSSLWTSGNPFPGFCTRIRHTISVISRHMHDIPSPVHIPSDHHVPSDHNEVQLLWPKGVRPLQSVLHRSRHKHTSFVNTCSRVAESNKETRNFKT